MPRIWKNQLQTDTASNNESQPPFISDAGKGNKGVEKILKYKVKEF